MALDHDNQMSSGIQGGVDATLSHKVFPSFIKRIFYQNMPFSVAVRISL